MPRLDRDDTSLVLPALLLVCLAVGILGGCGGGTGPTASSSVQGASSKSFRDEASARDIFTRVNEERATRGMRPLTRRPELDAVAQTHAQDLIRMNRLSHTSSDGRKLENRLENLEWEWAGENLARNKGFDTPAKEAVKGWIGSPKHFENMFRPDFSHTGIAALYDADSQFTYFVQIFTVPVD
ncbi:MAG: CAP domain-containing protein [Planctomycetes bacterium]|nr:CAP domain-containing protein [Planctomycetota bacterium]